MTDLNAHLTIKNSRIILKDLPCFDPFLSADCGQAFRWKVDENGILSGIIGKNFLKIKKLSEHEYEFVAEKDFFENEVVPYFDLERDYSKILDGYDNDILRRAIESCPGIRILRQDEWEALCSFIISQNNNIPRIKGIIDRLCSSFGERIDDEHFAFPSAERLSTLSVDDLAPLRAGFRAKYILDAARKVSDGDVDLKRVGLVSIEEGLCELEKIKGVGKKVAMCSLLYGFGKLDAFPEDVWVKRIMAELFPNGLPKCTEGTRGIAQQYLFEWYRNRQ